MVPPPHRPDILGEALYEEEEPNALEGGTVLDMVHSEEPLTVHKGQEGAERRYTQGEFRQLMLAHHENDDEAKRGVTLLTLLGVAVIGIFPEIPEGMIRDVSGDGEYCWQPGWCGSDALRGI